MDKRTKILLIVLGSLIVLAGGFYGYTFLTSGDEIAEVAQQPAPAPAKPPVAEQPVPAEPAPVEAAPAQPQTAQAGAPEAKPAAPAAAPAAPAAAPAATQQAAKPGEKTAPAAKPEAKPAAAAAGKTAPAAPCAPVLKVTVKGKTTEFKSPEELMEKSGMDGKALGEYSKKELDAAKKKLGALTKKRAAAGDIECAKKELELADKLAKLVNSKTPAKPEKEVYTYSSLDKRDPFMSPIEIPKVYPKIPLNAPPIEKVPSEQLKVMGIMWNQKGFRALLITPDGRGYTVKPGDTVGNKHGKVVKISERRVYIEERIPDIFGDIEVRSIVLKLHKEAE